MRQTSRQLLRILRHEADHSKASIARALGMSPSTINTLAHALIRDGLVIPTGRKQDLPQGRKGEVIDLNPSFRTAIGIEVTDLSVTGVVVDFAGGVHASHGVALAAPEHEHLLAALDEVIERLGPVAGGWGPLEGVGIASHGSVNPDTGEIVRFPGNPRWLPLNVAEYVAARIRTRCRVTFRILAATKGEVIHGGWAKTPGPIACFNSGPGNGFGLGIAVNGRVFTGAVGAAGQFGHFCVRPGGTRCFCGSHGCLLTVASIAAVLRRVRAALERGVESSLHHVDELTFRSVCHHAVQGDKLAASVIGDLAADLGLAMSYVMNLVNPSHVILGGAMAEGGEYLLEAIRSAAQSHCTAPIFASAHWVLSRLPWNAAALGAAEMMLDRYFEEGEGALV